MSKKNLVLIILGSIAALAIVIAAIRITLAWREANETAEDSQIEVGECVYHSATQTGYIELKISSPSAWHEKILQTSDDVLKNGFKFIVDDRYSLKVVQNDQEIAYRGYETDVIDKNQQVKIYFSASGLESDSLKIDLTDSEQEVTTEIPVELEIQTDCKEYKAAFSDVIIQTSPTGLVLNRNRVAALTSEYLNEVTMKLIGQEKTYILVTDAYTDGKQSEDYEIIEPTLYAEDEEEDTLIYVFDFDEWDKLESVEYGDFTFVASDIQEAIVEEYLEDLDRGIVMNYYKTSQGYWCTDEGLYKYRMEFEVEQEGADGRNRYVVLSNDESVTASEVSDLYYKGIYPGNVNDIVIVECQWGIQ